MTRPTVRPAFALAGLAVLAATAPVFAGYRTVNPVYLDTTNRQASGALSSARNSTDTLQYIQCNVGALRTITGEFDEYVSCVARNAAGVYGSCSSYEPMLIANARAISDGAYVSFAWNPYGECNSITVGKGSQYEVKGN